MRLSDDQINDMSEWEIENLPRRFVTTWTMVFGEAIDLFRGIKGESTKMTPEQADRAIDIFYGRK